MNSKDFLKLQGLLTKLNHVISKAEREDDCFRRYYQDSSSAIKSTQQHLNRLEQGLRTMDFVASTNR